MADKEYIEREATVRAVVDALNKILGIKSSVSLVRVAAKVREVPTAVVVEVRHGVWEKVSWWQHKNRYECNECSICGCRVKPKFTYNYCPNCGAKMDGKGEG